ncbi:hypothetical protein [Bacteroides fragilis]|jgi:hypothetical protein|uniref:hypothetical protein n=1 Tax=Bacteroides fragilis TaxID=817 RepID=UPI002456FDE8|nr:hypothetical protein [Bacteroides fragilis]
MNRDIIIAEDKKEKVIFYFAVFCELLKECIAKYGNISLEQAEQLVRNAKFLHQEINNVADVTYFSHERSFHWAMIILYGEKYWYAHPQYATIPLNYNTWETAFLARYQLTDYYEFIDKE